MEDFDQLKKDLYQTILDAQNGKFDPYDKVRHEAGHPRGISFMRLADIVPYFEAIPIIAAAVTRELVNDGLVIVHGEGTMDMSFEAIKST